MSEIGDNLRDLADKVENERLPAGAIAVLLRDHYAVKVDKLSMSEKRKGNHMRRNSKQRDIARTKLHNIKELIGNVGAFRERYEDEEDD